MKNLKNFEIRDSRFEIRKNRLSATHYPLSFGFTLIEMVIVIFLVAVLSLVITEMFFGQTRLYKVQFSQFVVLNDARATLDDVDNYVRQATRVVSTYGTYTTGSNTLVLSVQSINATNQLIPGTFDYVIYYLSAGALYRAVVPDVASSRRAVTKQLAGNVTNLNFTYNNVNFTLSTEVTTDITVLDTNNVQNRSVTVSSKSHLRNY